MFTYGYQHGREMPEQSARRGQDRTASTDVKPGSIVIAVMGITGSGKSSFIEHFGPTPVVGHTLQSCTSEVQAFACTLRDGTLIHLVDTPGFDDTNTTDTIILQKVANWFTETYGQGIKMTAIVYLHCILDTRLTGASFRNLNMFKKLVGKECLHNVVLVTSHWDAVAAEDEQKAESRDKELRETDGFWKDMIERGSQTARHYKTKQSAQAIVEAIVKRNRPAPLNIQLEMADGRKLRDTSAGQELQREIEQTQREFEQRLQLLKDNFSRRTQQRDAEHQASLAESKRKLEQRLRDNEEAAARLQANREELQEKFRQDANKAVNRKVEALRKEEEDRRRVREMTERWGIWRHPDCGNHWPHDPWHLTHCGHPKFM